MQRNEVIIALLFHSLPGVSPDASWNIYFSCGPVFRHSVRNPNIYLPGHLDYVNIESISVLWRFIAKTVSEGIWYVSYKH